MQPAAAQSEAAEPVIVEALLRQHPLVKEAVVLVLEDEPGAGAPMAYVVPDWAALKAQSRNSSRTPAAEIVDRWNRLYEMTYSAGPISPTFVGWTSSYTRQPIPESEMQEWLHTTLDRIRALKPRKVLEIGCGTGLFLQHLAPECDVYVGTDFSAAALARLQSWLHQRADMRHVQLQHRAANEFDDLEPGSFDTVVLNSVVQYFPDIEYLVAVLQSAVRLVGPGGQIFIGDVRNLQLLRTFHSAVQLSRAPDWMTVAQVRRRISRAVTQETELLIDPDFFHALRADIAAISSVDVQLKRGRAQNELTRYRYDIVLRTGGPTYATSTHRRSVPNQRLVWDSGARSLIGASDERLSVGALRHQLAQLSFDTADHPESFWAWGESLGREISVGWSAPEAPECFDVREVDRSRGERPACDAPAARGPRSWGEYANSPIENTIAQRFTLQLRAYLTGQVTESLIPLTWSVVKTLPRMPDGCVNWRALQGTMLGD